MWNRLFTPNCYQLHLLTFIVKKKCSNSNRRRLKTSLFCPLRSTHIMTYLSLSASLITLYSFKFKLCSICFSHYSTIFFFVVVEQKKKKTKTIIIIIIQRIFYLSYIIDRKVFSLILMNAIIVLSIVLLKSSFWLKKTY